MVRGKGSYGKRKGADRRIFFVRLFFVSLVGVILFRLVFLQVVNAGFYQALADGQHSFYEELFAERGEVFVKDWKDGSVYAAATTELRAFVFADPRKIENPKEAARQISEVLGYNTDISKDLLEELEVEQVEERSFSAIEAILLIPEPEVEEVVLDVAEDGLELDEEVAIVEEEEELTEDELTQRKYLALIERLSKTEDPYEPIARDVSEKVLQRILSLEIEGINYIYENNRAYPEDKIGGQLFGFLGQTEEGDRIGYYGVEGYFNDFLAGTDGYLDKTTDTSGRWIGVGSRQFQPAIDGGDIVLTIDRTIQHKVCSIMEDAVERYDADGGVAIVLEPRTAKVMAMCGAPDFDPDHYTDVDDWAVYQNQAIYGAYEPGSVIKPLVVAGAIDRGAISPSTTFNDTGEVTIGVDTIRNSDLKSNGIQTMTQVLENSLNTGMVFIMRQMGAGVMADYFRAFGFGERTGIELQTESVGNLSSLDLSSEIYAATASFGQGITSTPIQMAAAYNVLANQGNYLTPYIVEEKRNIDGSVETFEPKLGAQVISSKTASTITAMIVSVIENGHADLAAVDGYYLAGKTGTAQVAKTNGRGYDPDHTKATFAGYGPIEDPKFTIVVMIDKPRTTPWASDTAAPVFAEIADFLLNYFQIPPTRE